MKHYKTGVDLYEIHNNKTQGEGANWTKKN